MIGDVYKKDGSSVVLIVVDENPQGEMFGFSRLVDVMIQGPLEPRLWFSKTGLDRLGWRKTGVFEDGVVSYNNKGPEIPIEPTEPGHYWYRVDGDLEVCRVYKTHGFNNGNEYGEFLSVLIGNRMLPTAMANINWIFPCVKIPEPGEG